MYTRVCMYACMRVCSCMHISVCCTCMHIYACMYVCVFRTRPRWQRFASFCSPEPRLVPACSLCLARIFLPTRECLEKVVDFSVNKALRFLISLKLSPLRARAFSLPLSLPLPLSLSISLILSPLTAPGGVGWLKQSSRGKERIMMMFMTISAKHEIVPGPPRPDGTYPVGRGDGERNRETMVCLRIPCQKYRDATQTRGVTPK